MNNIKLAALVSVLKIWLHFAILVTCGVLIAWLGENVSVWFIIGPFLIFIFLYMYLDQLEKLENIQRKK